MSTYIRKSTTVEAVKFVYNDEGISNLTNLCGVELRNFGKSRGIFEKGWAWLGNNRKVALEGDYVVKEDGTFSVYKEQDFLELFTLVSGD